MRVACRNQHRSRPPRAAAADGFSLVELLVVISIILVLMAMAGAAVSAARNGQRQQSTEALIAKLDAVVAQQYAGYGARPVQAATPAARGVALRQLATGDLPDRWTDVQAMASNPTQYRSPHQRAYIGIWNSMATKPSPTFAGAECLFMIVMRGGIANCLACGDLADATIGDKDGDGASEFWDAWGNPVGFILWPGGLKLPAESSDFYFARAAPFTAGATGRLMRPLIYSAGPDGEYGFDRDNESGNLAAGNGCGDPAAKPCSVGGGPVVGQEGRVNDNVTNFDAEVRR